MKRELKVGDRVKVYGTLYQSGMVISPNSIYDFTGEVCTVEKLDNYDGTMTITHHDVRFSAHPKQCRRLVKRERVYPQYAGIAVNTKYRVFKMYIKDFSKLTEKQKRLYGVK